jgi:phosphate transport system permease protein
MAITTPDQLPPLPTGPPALVLEGASGKSFRNFSQEKLPRLVTGFVATVPVIALVAVLVVLFWKAYPAIRYNGWGFLTRTTWRPGNAYANSVKTGGVLHPVAVSYGALPLVAGTLETSAIALILAVPVSVGTALAVVEKLPRRVSNTAGLFLEVIAGVPSVVFGLWGVLTFGPFLAHHISPFIADHMPDVPVLDFFRGNVGYGEGLLASGMVLAIMIVPIVSATTRDLLRTVPRLPKEGALALGMNDWEVVRKVSLPWVRSGIIGAAVLGLARALGETIAVAMVSGTILGQVPPNLYEGMSTIAATIAQQLDGALSDGTGFEVRTLAEFALVLVAITLLTNLGARRLVSKAAAATALPVGRGV